MCEAERVWAEEARAEGIEQGIQKMVSLCQSLNMKTKDILQKLQFFYGLSTEKAMSYLAK